MGKNVEDFLDLNVDDIITLSDIQTQIAYDKPSVDFKITEVRVYKEPQDAFIYTAYIAIYKPKKGPEKEIMLLILQVGSEYELRVYYLDSDGASDHFTPLFYSNEDDLIDTFESSNEDEDGEEYTITFDKQGESSFGVEVSTTESEEPDCKTIAEYFTNDDNRGNPHCFIEWTGDLKGGYIEVWYGCEIKPEDVEMFPTQDN